MPRAIRVHQTGGADALSWDDVPPPANPGPGEAQILHHAIGLNYIDIYHRNGLYPLPELPATLGMEAAGEIVSLGSGVTEFAVGDRVAYATLPLGAYCERRNIPAERLVKLPADIPSQTAAVLLKGLTAEYLLNRTYPVGNGDTILIHAATGGVGLIMCQWAKALGASVIGTVSTREKAALAQENGCRHVIVLGQDDFVARVRAIAGGVSVVYDSIGKDTFFGSLDCLRPRGTLVSFGQSSGPVPAFDIAELSRRGSLYLTRPSLMTYTADRHELTSAAESLFTMISSGAIRPAIGRSFPLCAAADAHRALEARQTTGSSILIP